jgi:HNH endonuclease
MRPVTKGKCPQENGIDVLFALYGEARHHLINRIGDYCSYCEIQITNPAVEHVQPKNHNAALALDWGNFLLACINCNSIKGHDTIVMTDYYWADIHNTFLLFDFHPLGAVTLKNNPHLSVNVAISQRTLNLTGIERFGTSDADRRWIKRAETWGKAEGALDYYTNNNRPVEFILQITNMATSTGFFSVWMKIFENEPPVITALKNSFPNSFTNCDTTNINRV